MVSITNICKPTSCVLRILARVTRSSILLQGYTHNMIHLDPSVVPVVRECARRTRISVTSSQSFVPKTCGTLTFQKSFFIRTTRIWNLLITRLDLDNVTIENFKSVLYGYYPRALAINYDPDSPRSFKTISLKCNTARFFRLLHVISIAYFYIFLFWVRSNWL